MRKLLLALLFPVGCADTSLRPAAHDATREVLLDRAFDATRDDESEVLRAHVDDGPFDASLDASRDTASEAQVDGTLFNDVEIDPGRCGPHTRTCLCTCGSAVPCQNSCIARKDDCAFCIFEAATHCCPDEWRVLDECITRNMCTDDPCIRAHCGTDQRRLETCFATAQVSDERCREAMRGCLGSDYPMIRCVQP